MGIRIHRVYTKTGDGGETGLAGGQRVAKDAPRVAAYGDLDELNAVLGVLASQDVEAMPSVADGIRRIQNELFDLGAELATMPEDRRPDSPTVPDAAIDRLEREMDAMNEALPPLSSFVLPGGSGVAAHAHWARTVARRAERSVVGLAREDAVRPTVLRYLNRLSDWLFVLARFACHSTGTPEVLWQPNAAPSSGAGPENR